MFDENARRAGGVAGRHPSTYPGACALSYFDYFD